MEGAVDVDGDSWVMEAVESQLDDNPMSIVIGINRGYGGDPSGGGGDVPFCCAFRVGEDLACVCLG